MDFDLIIWSCRIKSDSTQFVLNSFFLYAQFKARNGAWTKKSINNCSPCIPIHNIILIQEIEVNENMAKYNKRIFFPLSIKPFLDYVSMRRKYVYYTHQWCYAENNIRDQSKWKYLWVFDIEHEWSEKRLSQCALRDKSP